MLRTDLPAFGVAGTVFRAAGEMRWLLAYFDNPMVPADCWAGHAIIN